MATINENLLHSILEHYAFSKFVIQEKPTYFGVKLTCMRPDEIKALRTSLENHAVSQSHADADEIKIGKNLPLTTIEDAFAAIFSLRPRWVAPLNQPIPASSSSDQALTEASLKVLFERHGFREPRIQTHANHFQLQSWTANPEIMTKFRSCLTHHGIQQPSPTDETSDLVITIPKNTRYAVLEAVFDEFNG